MDQRDAGPGVFSAHRSEALADGVFAIAMTLLVIELKLPDTHTLHDAGELAQALAGLLPKVISWALSFFVLGLFWIGHHRVFNRVRHVDGPLVALNLAELAVVTLMPFSCALTGEFAQSLLSQVIYSSNMFLLGVAALLIARYVYRHPELSAGPMPRPTYEAARLRIGGVMTISVLAVAIGSLFTVPIVGNMAFMLMALINPLSRRMERQKMSALQAHGASAATPSGGA